ncbi:MIOREX complex component 10 [Lasiodiplodia hormozganensis]|uniref:MIOREX complex component 10 n=2 Tax=Lasiodiplodia TaxID=66739 RepID=A0AA39YD34_9PEZI|nr:MIOREX complex component 10 [Lasiodiplodia hormozganensis]
MNALRYNALTSRATRALVARPTPFPPSYCRPPLARFALSANPRSVSNSARRTSSQAKDEVPASDSVVEEPKQEPMKRSRTSATTSPTTLRKVAVEAQRKRMRAKSELPNTEEAKKISAYCAAERYNIFDVARLLRAEGYEPDPFNTGLYPQVVHVQVNNALESKETGDIFVFPSGTVVSWNVPEKVSFRLVHHTLVDAAEGSHLRHVETEDLAYVEDSTRSSSDVSGDTIILGTGTPDFDPSRQTNLADGQDTFDYEVDTVLAKIAFSSGLARSTKLAVLEGLLDRYFDSTRSIPTVLSKGARLRFSRKFILMKTGELLNIRAQLNLYSELTDALPDIFWDSRHELGLEDYYTKVGRALDVSVRIKALNDKLTYAQEIAQVLSDRLGEKHGNFLEWIIIYLIFFEILLEINRLFKEWEEASDPESTSNLLKLYLEEELAKDKKNEEQAS